MQRFAGNAKFQSNVSQVLILTTNTNPEINLHIQNELTRTAFKNVLGVIPEKAKKMNMLF